MQRDKVLPLYFIFILSFFSALECSRQGHQSGSTIVGMLLPILVFGILIYFFGIRPAEKRKKLQSQSEIITENNKSANFDSMKNANPMILVVLGIILFISGLVSFFMRYEILGKFVSRGERLNEFLQGGNTSEITLTVIAIASAAAMMLGLLMLILGLIRVSKLK